MRLFKTNVSFFLLGPLECVEASKHNKNYKIHIYIHTPPIYAAFTHDLLCKIIAYFVAFFWYFKIKYFSDTQRYVVTFKTFGSYLEAPGWKSGDLAFSFRTTRSSGILLYQPLLHQQHNSFSVFLTNGMQFPCKICISPGIYMYMNQNWVTCRSWAYFPLCPEWETPTNSDCSIPKVFIWWWLAASLDRLCKVDFKKQFISSIH